MPIQAPQWSDYLTCPVCCREFGAPPRSPISLTCGHTICRHCLRHLHRRQCPFDQTVIQVEPEELVVNTALLQLAGYTPPVQPYHPPCIQALPAPDQQAYDIIVRYMEQLAVFLKYSGNAGGCTPPVQPYHPPCIQALPAPDQQAYDVIVRCMEQLAVFLKYSGNANNAGGSSRLSRPMQRKLVTLLQCAMIDEEGRGRAARAARSLGERTVTELILQHQVDIMNTRRQQSSQAMQCELVTLLQCAMIDEEGRGRAARAARSLGERTVTELILQHQNPQQLSANLWAAVRARGCQFLGPAMQEEVLKLVLLALEDGSALSRKVLVMFVVQRLEPHFPQASKTSIGHVVQLLYRASCFKVSKRECDSSLMQLKEEFRTYESLRREHDAQIVQIATEAGLRIAPDQWSALLYGDAAHKSHMQSIIDKLQTPQSFAQSVQELFIALQRTGDPAQLVVMSMHLDRLASIDASPDADSPTWQQLAEIMSSLKEVVSGLIHYLQNAAGRDANHNARPPVQERLPEPSTSQPMSLTATSTPTHSSKYKVSMCRDAATRAFCPRGNNCTFAHSEEEMERYRAMPGGGGAPSGSNGNMPFIPPPMPGMPLAQGMMPPLFPRFPLPQHPHAQHLDNYPGPSTAPLPVQAMPPPAPEFQENPHPDGIPPTNFPAPMIHNQSLGIGQNGMMMPVGDRYFGRYGGMGARHDDSANLQYARPEYPAQVYPSPNPITYQGQEGLPMANMFAPVPHEQPRNINSPYAFDDLPAERIPEYRVKPPYVPVPRERRPDAPWSTNDVFAFDGMRNTLPHGPTTTEDIFKVPGDRRAVGTDRVAGPPDACQADDQELEEELQALERRIDTEFKSAD